MDSLNNELDKDKYLVIKHAIAINILVFSIIIILLYSIRIGTQSILSMIIEYYLK
jgi:hypothetical protein